MHADGRAYVIEVSAPGRKPAQVSAGPFDVHIAVDVGEILREWLEQQLSHRGYSISGSNSNTFVGNIAGRCCNDGMSNGSVVRAIGERSSESKSRDSPALITFTAFDSSVCRLHRSATRDYGRP